MLVPPSRGSLCPPHPLTTAVHQDEKLELNHYEGHLWSTCRVLGPGPVSALQVFSYLNHRRSPGA